MSGQHPRFRTRTLGVGPRRGWGLLLECARISAFAAVHWNLSTRGSLCEGSRLSHGGPPTEATSPGATGSLSQHRAKQQKSPHPGNHFASYLCPPAAFWLWNKQQRSSNVGASQMMGDAQERSRRARRLLVQAALWAPSTAERLLRNCPTSARRCPHVGRGRKPPGTSSRQHSR